MLSQVLMGEGEGEQCLYTAVIFARNRTTSALVVDQVMVFAVSLSEAIALVRAHNLIRFSPETYTEHDENVLVPLYRGQHIQGCMQESRNESHVVYEAEKGA